MQDDDWMIPGRLHAPQQVDAHHGPEAPNVGIDPQFLARRELRKQNLGQQPTSRTDAQPWTDVDRS
jgi:hypothetical protein